MQGIARVKVGEVVVAAWFLGSSALLWWGAGYFRGDAPLVAFLVGLVGAAVGFTLLHLVEETDHTIRRIAVVGGFALAIPLALLDAGLLGIGTVVVAILLGELTAWRIARFRFTLRYVRALTLARFLLPSYFSAIGLIIAAVLLVSPVGAKALENPLPENVVRMILQRIDVSSIRLPAGVDFKDPLVREQFARLVGVSLESDDDLSAIISKLAARETVKLQDAYGEVYRLGFYLGAVGILRIFSVPISWLIMPVLFLFLRLLEATRRVVTVEEPTVRTVLKWE